MFNNFFENRPIYKIMWKNIIEPGGPQMTMWHMCIACGIRKSTNIFLGFVILMQQ
jgi:hypothetical protein